MTGYKINAQQGLIKDRVDKSCSINYTTGELSEKDFQIIRRANGVLGEIVFIPENADGLQPMSDKKPEGKSPSQRLRYAIQELYITRNGSLVNFQPFYEAYMTSIIQKVQRGIDFNKEGT